MSGAATRGAGDSPRKVTFSDAVEEAHVSGPGVGAGPRPRRRGARAEPGVANTPTTSAAPEPDAAGRRQAAAGELAGTGPGDAGGDADDLVPPFSLRELALPVVLIVLMSVGFYLNPPPPDRYHELPDSVKVALLEARAKQQGELDASVLRRSDRPAYAPAVAGDGGSAPSVSFVSPSCAPDEYPCMAQKPSLEFRMEHFVPRRDGERLLIVDGSKHYMDRGDQPGPEGPTVAVSIDGLMGAGPHEATIILLNKEGHPVAEDTVTFNLDEVMPERAMHQPAAERAAHGAAGAPAAASRSRTQEQAPEGAQDEPEAEAAPQQQAAKAQQLPEQAWAVDPKYSAEIVSPRPGATLVTPEIRFITEGLAVPEEGKVVLRVDTQDNVLSVRRARLALDGLPAGAHTVQIFLITEQRKVMAASDRVAFTVQPKG